MKTRLPIKLSAAAIAELGRLTRFGVVGIGATAIHFSIIGLFRDLAGAAPFILNGAAAGTAFLFSFAFHYIWSFRSQASIVAAISKFFSVSAAAFALSNGVLAALLQWVPVSNIVALLLAAMAIPAVTYILARLWVFAD